MIYLKLILTTIFWGGTFVAGRSIAGTVDPFSAAFLRFLIASVCLIVLTIKREGALPGLSIKKCILIVFLGLSGIFSYNLFFFFGLNHIQANQASLIIASNPIFISICSFFFFKEKIGPFKAFGLILSLSGAIIVISGGAPFSLLAGGLGKGQLLILGCVASWVLYSILGKTAMTELSPITTVCYSAIAGTLMLAGPALYNGMFDHIQTYPVLAWAALFYLGFFGTVLGFLWYYEGIKAIGPTKAGIFINFVPVSAIILAFFLLNEPLSLSLAVGAACVTCGIYIANTKA